MHDLNVTTLPPPILRNSSVGTEFHAKYYAYALTRKCDNDFAQLQQPLLSAKLDLNPHQIQAALFALNTTREKGVLLADEVGLGKTIEAGLVLCQLWSERKRKLLVICPAALRKQWQLELGEKFNLPSEILDAKRLNALRRAGTGAFSTPKVYILSYHFAAKQKDLLRETQWDLVCADECHKLKNSHRESNIVGQALRWALAGRKKLLLSATPLQNSLAELYGVATLIDEEMFGGDFAAFRSRYMNVGGDIDGLRERLADFCRRTLRKDVTQFVRYTQRFPMTIRFESSEAEARLYEDVSRYLQDETSYAFPQKQRLLLVMVVRKLLASSGAALAGTLEKILLRLQALREKAQKKNDDALLVDFLNDDAELRYLLEDEGDDEEDETESDENPSVETPPPSAENERIDPVRLDAEIKLVRSFITRLCGIGTESKAQNLLVALHRGWEKLAEIGAEQKAVIFTESRRSMLSLKNYLEANGYAGDVVCFSGGGNDGSREREIYEAYLREHPENAEGKAVAFRHALIEHFRTKAKILISTEAGAEGLNLQFCSMVVNYDLPWNPQRVEQRIGRCHRYGQKFDVVVVNFINTRNAADVRVFELLSEKLKLFEGIFGASNEILGVLDDAGISFERRIHEILQKCRTAEEINAEFERLREEMSEKIAAQMAATHNAVLENLDASVLEKLKGNFDSVKFLLETASFRFWNLTKFVLREHAAFDDEKLCFALRSSPFPGVPAGSVYSFNKENDTLGIPYRPNSELGEKVIEAGKRLATDFAEVRFNISDSPVRIVDLEKLKGKSGYLLLNRLSLESLDRQEFLLFSCVDDNGAAIEHEIAEKLFRVLGARVPADAVPAELSEKLAANSAQFAKATTEATATKNNELFKTAAAKIERRSDDKIAVAQEKIDRLRDRKKELSRQSALAETLDEQARILTEKTKVECDLNRARREIHALEDEAIDESEKLLAALRRKLSPQTSSEILFTLRWRVV